MNFVALSSLVSAIISLTAGHIAFSRNPKSTLTRVFFMFAISAAYISFTEFGLRMAETLTLAKFWLRASFLLNFPLALELHFVLLFSGRKNLIKNRLTYLVLYGPAVMFSLLVFYNPEFSEPVKVPWGWTYNIPDNALNQVYDLWIAVVVLTTLFISIQNYLKSTDKLRKHQAWLIMVGVSASSVIGFIEVVSFKMELGIPELTSIGIAVECGFFLFAMLKYELFALNPFTAAESIVATLTDALFLVDKDEKITSVNQSTLDLLGYEEFELVGQPVDTIISKKDDPRFKRLLDEHLLTEDLIHDTAISLVNRDGKTIPISLSTSVVRDSRDIYQGAIFVGRDLTDRILREEQLWTALTEKEMFLKEIHHRVKNNLQIISSLLVLQAESTQEEQALLALSESRDRVASMAVVHEMLYQSEDLIRINFAEYTHRLVGNVMELLRINPQTISLKIDIEDVSIDVGVATYCGLIINELVSNSLKYAFPSMSKGEIGVTLESSQDGRLTLIVHDNGCGLPPGTEPGNTETLGLQLVDILIQQLDGELELSRRGGTEYKIRFYQQPS